MSFEAVKFTEQEILAELIMHPRQEELGRALEQIRDDDFIFAEHRHVLKAIREVHAEDGLPSHVNIFQRLRGNGDIATYCDLIMFARGLDCTGLLPDSLNFLRENARRRELKQLVCDITKSDGEVSAESLQKIETLMATPPIEEKTNLFGDFLRRLCDRMAPRKRETPFRQLEESIGGLQSCLTVLASRPGVGKSAVLTQLARHLICEGKNVLLITTDMTTDEILPRMIQQDSGIQSRDVQTGDVSEIQVREITQIISRLAADKRLRLLDMRGKTSAEICTAVQREHLKRPAALILIDQLQGIRFDPKWRWQQIGDATKAFNTLAQRLKTPVILACQLSRTMERHGIKSIPMLSDLRDSGEIEQDAPIVIFLHRAKEGTQCILAKNRYGPRIVLRFDFNPKMCTFEEAGLWRTE